MKIDGKPKSYSRIYNIWRLMKRRCNNQNDPHYYVYGGRGIKVCPEWNKSSDVFIEWAYAHGYANELELDRIDPDKDYAPENCRWITKKENIKRTRKPYTSALSQYNLAHKKWVRYRQMGLSDKFFPEPKLEDFEK